MNKNNKTTLGLCLLIIGLFIGLLVIEPSHPGLEDHEIEAAMKRVVNEQLGGDSDITNYGIDSISNEKIDNGINVRVVGHVSVMYPNLESVEEYIFTATLYYQYGPDGTWQCKACKDFKYSTKAFLGKIAREAFLLWYT